MGASNFKIIMSSDEKYNDLCAEIYYEDQFVPKDGLELSFNGLLTGHNGLKLIESSVSE